MDMNVRITPKFLVVILPRVTRSIMAQIPNIVSPPAEASDVTIDLT